MKKHIILLTFILNILFFKISSFDIENLTNMKISYAIGIGEDCIPGDLFIKPSEVIAFDSETLSKIKKNKSFSIYFSLANRLVNIDFSIGAPENPDQKIVIIQESDVERGIKLQILQEKTEIKFQLKKPKVVCFGEDSVRLFSKGRLLKY